MIKRSRSPVSPLVRYPVKKKQASGKKDKWVDRTEIYRIIDANLNRAREGLRVCEEIVRFILGDQRLTRRLKQIRHKITGTAKSLPINLKVLLKVRNSASDVGKETIEHEAERANYQEIFVANIQRVEESIRVLEEFTKVIDRKISEDFKSIRFQVYELEKETVERFPALCNNG